MRSRRPTIALGLVAAFLIAAAALVVPCSALARTVPGWTTVDTADSTLRAVHSVDGTIVVTGGDDGLLMASSDAGAHWSATRVGATHVAAVRVVGPRLLAALWDGRILHSSGPGARWQSASGSGRTIRSWDFRGPVGVAVASDGTTHSILRTDDGGVTWTTLVASAPWAHVSGSISIIDSARLYASGADGWVYASADGGRTWEQRGQLRNVSGAVVGRITFVDADNGWATAHRMVKRTSDGGRTWVLASGDSGWSTYSYMNLRATSASEAVLMRGDHAWLETTDGGATWSQIASTPSRSVFASYARHRTDSGRIWLVGSAGEIEYTDGDGSSRVDRTSGNLGSVREIAARGPSEAFAAAQRGLYRVTAEGSTRLFPGDFRRVQVIDAQHIVAGGVPLGDWGGSLPPTLLSSSDGGRSWTLLQLPGVPRSMRFATPSVGRLCTDSFQEYSTTDGGVTWVHDPQVYGAYDIAWGDDRMVYETETYNTGGSSALRVSTDAGGTWAGMSDPGWWMRGTLDFVDATHGWVAGDDAVFRTTDGASWTKVFEFGGTTLRGIPDIDFTNPTAGWMAAGPAYQTTDGGESWDARGGFPTYTTALSSVTTDTVWVGTYGGTVHVTTTAGRDTVRAPLLSLFQVGTYRRGDTSAKLKGYLTDDAPLEGRVVTLERRERNGWIDTGLCSVTSADGGYSFAVKPTRLTYYRAVLPASDPALIGRSNVVRVAPIR